MTMSTQSIRCTVLAALLVPTIAGAEPVTLKFSFFASDRSNIYQCNVKPFVEAINNDVTDQVRIEVNFGSPRVGQLKLVLEGATDIAVIPVTESPDQFTDRAVFQLPGIFRDQAEASLVFTRLIEAGALPEYKNLLVLGSVVTAGETIHSRKPITALDNLRGQTIRVSNEIEAITLRKFGSIPVLLPINQTMDSLSQGKIDGVAIPVSSLSEFGFGRLTVNHYLLQLGGVPMIHVMNRAKFESLPTQAQEIVRKYSGAWLAETVAACLTTKGREVGTQLVAEPRRKVVTPSPADQATVDRVFAEVTEDWAAQNPRNRELLGLVKAEIVKVRAGK